MKPQTLLKYVIRSHIKPINTNYQLTYTNHHNHNVDIDIAAQSVCDIGAYNSKEKMT